MANLPAAKAAGFEAFLDAITGKDATLVTAREAAYRSAVMEAIYEGVVPQQLGISKNCMNLL